MTGFDGYMVFIFLSLRSSLARKVFGLKWRLIYIEMAPPTYLYVSIWFYIVMKKKAYCVTLVEHFVTEVRSYPEQSLSGLLNRLLKKWIEEQKQ